MYAHKMELKVWVEGIQRVICGVTEATTCQDVVIALAHATGKTGRFTLVERWRDSERLLAPTEPPLRVLHKWGEYACDVQFILRHSDKERRRGSSGRSGSGRSSSSANSSLDHGSKRTEKFLHNFTPHQQPRRMSGSSIRKSLTFSGAHTFFPPLKSGSTSPHVKSASGIAPCSTVSKVPTTESSSVESLGDDRISYCSSRSSSSPYASLEKQCRRGYIGAGRLPTGSGSGSLEYGSDGSGSAVPGMGLSPHRSPHSGGGVRESPSREHRLSSSSSQSHSPQKQSPRAHHTHQHHQQQQIVVPQPLHNNTNNRTDLQQQSTNNNNIAKVVATQHTAKLPQPPQGSPGESRDFCEHNGMLPEPEVVTEKMVSPKKDDLMKLVRLQQERLGVQDSQIKILDSEIQYWEGREKDMDHQYQAVHEETTRLQQTEHRLEDCLQELDLVSWADKLGIEQQQEKMLRSELTLIRSQIQNAESELLAAKSKLTSVTGELEEERRCAVSWDQENKEMEIKILQEISDLQKQINRKLLLHEQHAGSLEQLTTEVKSLESAILEKKSQITDWEKELRAANLTFFVQAPTTDWLHPPTNDTGEKSFGRLSPSRPGSSRRMLHNPQMLKETVATTKNPHGMWV